MGKKSRNFCFIFSFGPCEPVALLLITAATITTFISTFNCNFFHRISKDDITYSRNFGFWTIEDLDNPGSCVAWPKDMKFDGFMKAGRALSLMSVMIGTVLFALMLVPFFSKLPHNRYMQAVSCWTMVLTHLLTACMFGLMTNYCGDPFYCTVDTGGYVSVAACCLWFVGSIAIGQMQKTLLPRFKTGEWKQKREEREKQLDGDENRTADGISIDEVELDLEAVNPPENIQI